MTCIINFYADAPRRIGESYHFLRERTTWKHLHLNSLLEHSAGGGSQKQKGLLSFHCLWIYLFLLHSKKQTTSMSNYHLLLGAEGCMRWVDSIMPDIETAWPHCCTATGIIYWRHTIKYVFLLSLRLSTNTHLIDSSEMNVNKTCLHGHLQNSSLEGGQHCQVGWLLQPTSHCQGPHFWFLCISSSCA